MRPFLGVACFAFAFLTSALSWAATIEPGQGDLSVNQGQGFQRVNIGIDANVGDSVMVSPNGSATVSYPDGCQVPVQPGSVVTIAPLSPCASGSVAQFSDSGDWGPPLMGAAFIAAIGFAVYGITQANKNSTPSPASP
jgi:hypothetical protein